MAAPALPVVRATPVGKVQSMTKVQYYHGASTFRILITDDLCSQHIA